MSGRARPVLVRFDRDMGEFQAQCGDCAKQGRQSYFPLTLDFWVPSQGVQRCKACVNTKRRLARRAAMDAKAKQRAYYAANKAHRLAWVRDYRAKNRERINEVRRAAYARKVAAAKAASPQMEAFPDGA